MHPMPRATLATLLLLAAALFGPLTPPAPLANAAQQADDQPPTQLSPGDRVVLVLRDGRTLRGELLEQSDEQVVLLVGGVRTPVEAEDVRRLEPVPPVVAEYERMRRVIDDRDAEQLLLLAEWLLREREYDLALQEVRGVLELRPRDGRALELKRLLEQQIALRRAGEDRARRPEIDDADTRERRRFPLLTPEQINLIRVFEVDLSDPPRMMIARETIDRIVERYADSELVPSTPEGRASLYRKRPDQILDLLFRLRARDLYGEVKVLEHPTSMRRFREDVHGEWLMPGCATSRCHGGEQAGRLWLATRKSNSDATIYTNFIILDRFRLADGTPLIDWDKPADSPLLHLALPREVSRHPHPPINELGRERPWRAPIPSQDHARFRETVRWIQSMYRPHPEYPVTYEPPVPAAAESELPQREPGEPR